MNLSKVNEFIYYTVILFSVSINAQTNNVFPTDGNVGIGTASPTSKLTVKGHVNIGDDGNYRLRVRHIDGKDYDSPDKGTLCLNFGTGEKVLVGWGNPTPASDLGVSGRLGLGTSSPTHHIDVINAYRSTEDFLRFRVQDATQDYFRVYNATGTAGQFIPVLRGHHVSDNRSSLYLMGSTDAVNDNGDNALVTFDARIPTGPIQNRPLFEWRSYQDRKMTLMANGNLGVGVTTPDSKLTVNGNIRAKEVKVEATNWPDYVFKGDYKLPSLLEIKKYINEKGHLPNIPAAEKVETDGLELGEMNRLLLEKIEELVLYTIAQEEDLQEKNTVITQLTDRLTAIENRLGEIEASNVKTKK